MTDITINFEYDVPDEYFYQTKNLGFTGKFDYIGPESLYLFADKNTGHIDETIYIANTDSEARDFAERTADENQSVVFLDAKTNPLIAYLIVNRYVNVDELPQKEYKIEGDDTVYFNRPDPLPPHMAYERKEIFYSFSTNSFTVNFKKPYADWDNVVESVNSVVEQVNEEIESGEFSQEDVKILEDYRDRVSKIPERFKDWDAWTVPMYDHPLHELPTDNTEEDEIDDEDITDEEIGDN